MSYYADPKRDLPAPWKLKRVLFYREGMKIYGQIPYILQRRLKARFYSNNAPLLGGRVIGPTLERNYTVIPYRRPDGRPHSQEALAALFDWLWSDQGFEWAIAVEWHKHIQEWNVFNAPPMTFVPGKRQIQDALIETFFLEGGPLCLPSSSSKP